MYKKKKPSDNVEKTEHQILKYKVNLTENRFFKATYFIQLLITYHR